MGAGLRRFPRRDNQDCQEIAVAEGFSHYLQQVAAHLPYEAAKLVHGDLNLTLLDWYTEGVRAEEAAARIRRSAGWA
jgi:hypothetical protein